MIGSGIFALPSQMASSAGPGSAPHRLGDHRLRHADAGLRLPDPGRRASPTSTVASTATPAPGFGNYIGFTSAWGYWVSAWVGNVGYLVLLGSTLGYFWPSFEGGNTCARDPRRLGGAVGRPRPDPARRAQRGVRQHRRDHRQGGPDRHLHRDRRGRLQGRHLHPRHLGPLDPDRRCLARQHPRPGQEHDARDRLGVHRHRGRSGLLPAGRQAQRRRSRPRSWASSASSPCC